MKALARIGLALMAVLSSAGTLAMLWPHARDASALLLSRNDPVRLSDARLDLVLRNGSGVIPRGIDEALEAGDAGLAKSFLDLADARDVPVSTGMRERVQLAVEAENSAGGMAARFAQGFVTGEADDGASLSGTVAGDLFVFGDIRDALREGKRLALGEEADRLVLGLAGAGLAVTAATYVSGGGAAAVRAGLTVVKDARKMGRLGAGLAEWAGRSAREVVDTPMLREAVATASVLRPMRAVDAVKAAFRTDKAGALLHLAKDIGRIGEKAGTRGALDVLRIADGPDDVARAARLAEANGGKTRAIVKLLGRGALLLTAGAFHLASWLFAALLAMFGFMVSIKAMTERLTLAWLRRSKLRRARRELAAQS